MRLGVSHRQYVQNCAQNMSHSVPKALRDFPLNQIVLLDLVQQGLVADLQFGGRSPPVPVVILECLCDEHRFSVPFHSPNNMLQAGSGE